MNFFACYKNLKIIVYIESESKFMKLQRKPWNAVHYIIKYTFYILVRINLRIPWLFLLFIVMVLRNDNCIN